MNLEIYAPIRKHKNTQLPFPAVRINCNKKNGYCKLWIFGKGKALMKLTREKGLKLIRIEGKEALVVESGRTKDAYTVGVRLDGIMYITPKLILNSPYFKNGVYELLPAKHYEEKDFWYYPMVFKHE